MEHSSNGKQTITAIDVATCIITCTYIKGAKYILP